MANYAEHEKRVRYLIELRASYLLIPKDTIQKTEVYKDGFRLEKEVVKPKKVAK